MKKILINSFLFLSVILAFTACEKAEIKDGGGKTLVKFVEGGETPVVLPLNTAPAAEEVQLFEIGKDAKNQGDLNTATSVTVTNTQAYLDAYNDSNHTEFELLPADSYTFTAASGVSVSGNTWTVNLAPGEFVKGIAITLDKSKLDLSKSYAFGLQITGSTVGSVSAAGGISIVNIIIKNKYDGSYTVTGSMTDAANGGLTGSFPMTYHLVTTGASSVIGLDPVIFNLNVVPIKNAGADSYYGSFVPIFQFDGNDNVVAVTNGYGQPAGNGRYAQIDPSGINKRDASGNIQVKFFMFQPSVIALPAPRVSFTWRMNYNGPR